MYAYYDFVFIVLLLLLFPDIPVLDVQCVPALREMIFPSSQVCGRQNLYARHKSS